jgi:uncharacterized protein DUF1801
LDKYLEPAIMNPLDKYYLDKEEPYRSCLQSLRSIVLGMDRNMTEKWRYGMPFFYCKGRMACYLWLDKKNLKPYLGIVEGSRVEYKGLEQGKRKRMKIYVVDPHKNLPVKDIKAILKKMLRVYDDIEDQ